MGATAHGKRFRHRIEPAAAQRLTARDAPQRERAATQCAEARHRDSSIVRTARMEAAARAEQRAQAALVKREQGENDAGHEAAVRKKLKQVGT